MNAAKKPIGIFDSGIGGLTVARAIKNILTNEDLIYFGDTAHLPYGDKSAKAIKQYCVDISQFLKKHDVKMIVIACNTASASGFKSVQKVAGKEIIVVNVIDPVVEYVLKTDLKHIGVIGTKRTIESNLYAKKIKKASNKKVSSLATPLLAPMIEEGFFNNKISQTVINSYLSKSNLKNIDSLILGCTHYPLIKKEIENYYKNKVSILDSASVVADRIKSILETKHLVNPQTKTGSAKFFVSDFTESFKESSKIFFGEEVNLKEVK